MTTSPRVEIDLTGVQRVDAEGVLTLVEARRYPASRTMLRVLVGEGPYSGLRRRVHQGEHVGRGRLRAEGAPTAAVRSTSCSPIDVIRGHDSYSSEANTRPRHSAPP